MSKTSNYVHHRLTLDGLSDDMEQKYIDWLKSKKYECLMVRECHNKLGEPVRPHLHVSIHVSFSNAQYVKLFRKDFPQVKGQKMQGSHNIEHPKLNDNYMCKGYKDKSNNIVAPDIRFATLNYTPEYILQCHKDFWSIYDNTQKNLTPAPVSVSETVVVIEKPKKKRAPTWMEKIPVICIEQYPQWEWDNSVDSKCRIYRIVMRELGNAVKKISPRIIREICDGVQNTLAPQDTENEFWRKVYPEEFNQVANGFFRDY